jgi:hypothetical protein
MIAAVVDSSGLPVVHAVLKLAVRLGVTVHGFIAAQLAGAFIATFLFRWLPFSPRIDTLSLVANLQLA